MNKLFLSLAALSLSVASFGAEPFITFRPDAGSLPLVRAGKPLPILSDEQEAGIRMALESLSADFARVTGTRATLTATPSDSLCILVGSLESPLIRQLIKDKKLDEKMLKGKRETYVLQTVDRPTEGVSRALVIAGSDKRGTIYGIYELSEQLGVSPWYWWADTPVVQRTDVYALPGSYTDGEPAVKYRGIFINDEWPCMGNWAQDKFGGFNSKMYAHVFELLLRLKGNFLWPAMWGSAFYADDAENSALADRMGIVVGTSHHEPMARNHQEYARNRDKYGAWDYQTNAENLNRFFREGMERVQGTEDLITIGMRGDGDEAMGEDTNIKLLERIVKEQRNIIADVTGKSASKTPQVWALYKEVQDYYDQGMKVPDDVTLLFCDDNWGNVRRLPDLDAKPRKGGYGMYYHFDYVGAPRNSKWINISPIPRVWEQLNLTYEYGIRELWVVNVGDLKPMEYPIDFFLDMAWNPRRFHADNLREHTEQFCRQQFGDEYAQEAARLLWTYPKYNRRVTPELLNADTYSFNYGEWERVVNEYNALAQDAENLRYRLPSAYQDTYEQLVNYPVQASANLYNLYYAQAMNRRLAKEHNTEANFWAARVESCYLRDSLLSHHYNKVMSDGKWDHMMDQIHIGYTSWNNPDHPVMPKVTRVAVPTAPYAFAETDGHVSIEAAHYTRAIADGQTRWQVILDLGKTLSGITTLPVTESPEQMQLEYDIDFTKGGTVEVTLLLAPTLNFNHNKGMRYAVSFDGGEEQVVNFNGHYRGELGRWQANPIIESKTKHTVGAGKHTLRIRPLDAGIVFEKILIDCGGLKPSYLGAPETLKD